MSTRPSREELEHVAQEWLDTVAYGWAPEVKQGAALMARILFEALDDVPYSIGSLLLRNQREKGG